MRHHFLILFFFNCSLLLLNTSVAAQNINNIKIITNNKHHQKTLDKISSSIRENNDSLNISLHKNLTKYGFLNYKIDSLQKRDSSTYVYITTKNKINFIKIYIEDELNIYYNRIKIIKPERLEEFLNSLNKKLENQGYSFSSTKLTNQTIKEDTLTSDLVINYNKKRFIDRIIVKGYEKFPNKYIKNLIKRKKIYSTKNTQNISNYLKKIKFISEIKPSETLFSKDSTLLYLYLQKKKANSFDGIMNFNSDNGKIIFTGNIDLELNNTLNGGEQFNLNWKANGNERQNLNIKLENPYILNSNYSLTLDFSLYKQDSSFINTNFNSSILREINNKISLGIAYQSQTSSTNYNTDQITGFNSHFIGLIADFYMYYNNTTDKKLGLSFKALFGSRKIDSENTRQIKLDLITDYLFKLNHKHHLYFKNETGILLSNSYLNNELYRIGGINSIRGFLEESIFTSKYSYLNTEYRINLNRNTITLLTDIGLTNRTYLSGGIGYSLNARNYTTSIYITKPLITNKNNNAIIGISVKNIF
ncbi:hypothetical protein [Tenacibaculum geojense]|uniref:POTRA domain-containing protein n=1 Tax=Tenacibaculum geojense TaxID=915352 RepID=A0ABW3JRZ1_9FLAO